MTADSYSNTLGFLEMATGNDNNAWGSNANASVFQVFEDAIANVLSSAVTGGTLDLSGSPPPAAASQVRYAALIFTGTLTSNQILKVPNLTKWWWVSNQTSGAYTLTIKTPSGSASAAIPQNSGWQLVQCDGANNLIVSPFNSKQVQMPDGTVSAPAYSNINETNSGWYRHGASDWRLAIAGTDILQVTGSVVNVLTGTLEQGGSSLLITGNTVDAADGTVAAPGFGFNAETGTGFYRAGAGHVGFAILGTEYLDLTTTNFTWSGVGTFSWAGATVEGGDLSPTSFSTSQNNYNPTNLSTATCLRLNVTGLCSLTGLAGGAAGRVIELSNVGSATLQCPANSASSTAANRFASTFNLPPNTTITLRYDATQSLWVPRNIVTAFAQCAIAAVSPDLLIINHSGTENTKLDITCGEAVLTDTSGNAIKFESVSVTIDSTTTGPNGCDTGTRGASTLYFIYLVSDGTSIKGVISTSSSVATMLTNLQANGGANYVYAKRVGAQFTDSSSNFKRVRQLGRRAQYVITASTNTALAPNIANGAAGTYSATSPTLAAASLSGIVPSTAVAVHVMDTGTYTGDPGTGCLIAPNASWGGTNNGPRGTAGQVWPRYNAGNTELATTTIMLESTSIYWAAANSGAAISCLGWEDAI